MVYIVRSFFVLREHVLKLVVSKTETIFNANLKQDYKYHTICEAFFKFYQRHSELIVKYNIGLKTLLQQGISESVLYGNLVHKCKRIVGKPNFSNNQTSLKVGYNMDIM